MRPSARGKFTVLVLVLAPASGRSCFLRCCQCLFDASVVVVVFFVLVVFCRHPRFFERKKNLKLDWNSLLYSCNRVKVAVAGGIERGPTMARNCWN